MTNARALSLVLTLAAGACDAKPKAEAEIDAEAAKYPAPVGAFLRSEWCEKVGPCEVLKVFEINGDEQVHRLRKKGKSTIWFADLVIAPDKKLRRAELHDLTKEGISEGEGGQRYLRRFFLAIGMTQDTDILAWRLKHTAQEEADDIMTTKELCNELACLSAARVPVEMLGRRVAIVQVRFDPGAGLVEESAPVMENLRRLQRSRDRGDE